VADKLLSDWTDGKVSGRQAEELAERLLYSNPREAFD
jgi:hypothetical protein